MPHPLLGVPPSDPHAGLPEAAERLRSQRRRLADLALRASLGIDATLTDRHDELALRTLLRDYDQHIEQLARALETGEDRYVVIYAETLVPIYRRRGIRVNDAVTFVQGLREAARSALTAEDAEVMQRLIAAWCERLRRHARLAGDHKGNPIVRFIWKNAGLGDDSVV
jgi:hypothetical protein